MGEEPEAGRMLGTGEFKLELERMPGVAAVNAQTGKGKLTKCGARYAELENNASIVREVVKNPCLLSAKFHTVPSVRIVMALVYVRAIGASKG